MRSEVDEFVPHIQHVNLRILGKDLAAAALLERFGLFCHLQARNLMPFVQLRHLRREAPLMLWIKSFFFLFICLKPRVE